jgi:thiol-disulfide isomerase/thioredoxin
MVSISVMVCALAVTAGGETVLLDFGADWCGPCRQMEPVIHQLQAAGHPVRAVNIDREPELARKFNVTGVPCFVMLVDGREVAREVGGTSYARLEQMLQSAGATRPARGPIARGQSPEQTYVPRSMPSVPSTDAVAMTVPVRSDKTVQVSTGRGKDLDKQLIASTVRLRIDDPNGNSFGSGTIIDSRSGEALILTCAHIFRSSNGQGKIAVDLFGDNSPKGVPATMVGYDLDADVALVSIRPTVPVTATPLAAKDYKAAKGEAVISVGCDHGNDPTVQRTRVTGIDKFLGPSNLQTDGQPVQGRSGGGLFTADGRVLGVCNAADPTDNEGLFAALPTIYGYIGKLGLNEVLVSKDAPPAFAATPPAVAPASVAAPAATGILAANESKALAEIQNANGAEVICIVRSHSDPRAKSEIIVLDRASPKFMEQLAADRVRQGSRQPTSLDVPAARIGWQPKWNTPAVTR